MKKILLMCTSVLILLLSGCGEQNTNEKEYVPPVPKKKYLDESETVNKAFSTFEGLLTSNLGNKEIVAKIRTILENPVNGETSPDIDTALAFMDVFDLTEDPILKSIVSFDIKNYDKIVTEFMTAFESSSVTDYLVNSNIDVNITDINEVNRLAQDSAKKFRNLSDKLKLSFPDENYVFRYWSGDGLTYDNAQAMRVVLLTVAAQLEFLSSYSYGKLNYYKTNVDGYIPLLVDPVSVLNQDTDKVFAMNDTARLDTAKTDFTNALTIAKDINLKNLDFIGDGVDYKSYQDVIPDVLKNLSSNKNFEYTIKDFFFVVDTTFVFDFKTLFSKTDYIDIEDFNGFEYKCYDAKNKDVTATTGYDLNASKILNKPMCKNNITATLHLNTPDVSNTDLDALIVEAQTIIKNMSGQLLLNQMFDYQVPDEIK